MKKSRWLVQPPYSPPELGVGEAARILREYGITVEQYLAEHERLGGHCAVCGDREYRLQIDYCHRTGKVRGLVCRTCNWLLGKVEAGSRAGTGAELAYLTQPSPWPGAVAPKKQRDPARCSRRWGRS